MSLLTGSTTVWRVSLVDPDAEETSTPRSAAAAPTSSNLRLASANIAGGIFSFLSRSRARVPCVRPLLRWCSRYSMSTACCSFSLRVFTSCCNFAPSIPSNPEVSITAFMLASDLSTSRFSATKSALLSLVAFTLAARSSGVRSAGVRPAPSRLPPRFPAIFSSIPTSGSLRIA